MAGGFVARSSCKGREESPGNAERHIS